MIRSWLLLVGVTLSILASSDAVVNVKRNPFNSYMKFLNEARSLFKEQHETDKATDAGTEDGHNSNDNAVVKRSPFDSYMNFLNEASLLFRNHHKAGRTAGEEQGYDSSYHGDKISPIDSLKRFLRQTQLLWRGRREADKTVTTVSEDDNHSSHHDEYHDDNHEHKDGDYDGKFKANEEKSLKSLAKGEFFKALVFRPFENLDPESFKQYLEDTVKDAVNKVDCEQPKKRFVLV